MVRKVVAVPLRVEAHLAVEVTAAGKVEQREREARLRPDLQREAALRNPSLRARFRRCLASGPGFCGSKKRRSMFSFWDSKSVLGCIDADRSDHRQIGTRLSKSTEWPYSKDHRDHNDTSNQLYVSETQKVLRVRKCC